jgi:hypothetical protein
MILSSHTSLDISKSCCILPVELEEYNMIYVKSCLIITMLLGVGYSQDCDPDADVGWNCDCNEDTWQEYYPDMIGCYLQGANLEGAMLYGAYLSGADLSWADLQEAWFLSAYLEGANLQGANLSGATLIAASFLNANLTGANLSDAGCLGALFVRAELDWTNFEDADLQYAYFDETGHSDCIIDPQGEIGCDGYDDASFDAGVESVDVGDMNDDGENNVQDVILLVNNILNP